MKTYTIPREDFYIIYNGSKERPIGIIRDDEEKEFSEFSEENLKEYFETSYDVFMKRLDMLRDPRKTVTDYDEKELLFMLEALIHAKRSLEESEQD